MNKEFSNGPLRGMLWLHELPQSYSKCGLVLSANLAAVTASESDVQEVSAGIEVFTHRGPRVLFAHIGGTFKPDVDSEVLKLEVTYVDHLVEKCETPLSLGAGETYIGLEKIYAEAVLSGLKKAVLGGIDISSGVISINCGAISKISSSPIVYEKLGERICSILSLLSAGKEVSESTFKLSL